MTYIRKVKNREGKIYVYLAESYRVGNKVKSRVLKNFGLLEKLESIDPDAYDKLTVYKALSFINILKSDIQKTLHESISSSIGRSAMLVFYDVTNYYFETDLDDEDFIDKNGEIIEGFRKKGPSKEKRPNPIVQLGLFMDSNAIPKRISN